MDKLFEIQQVILEQFDSSEIYQRNIFKSINFDNFVTGIIGSRGIGKTTFLLLKAIENGAKKRKALYVSADNVYFLENKLVDLVGELYQKTECNMLFIDEIHKYPNWNQELKNISDIYPNFKVVFSGSSTIDLVKTKYDLSRRVTLHNLYGLSFREYLEYYKGMEIEPLSLGEVVKNTESIEIKQVLKHFKDYLGLGYYPFFKRFSVNEDKYQAIENSVQKTIYEDISSMYNFRTSSLQTIESIYKYIINSSPGEISPYKLSQSLSKDFESVTDYLQILVDANLARSIYNKKTGHSFLRSPAKVYPENTNLIYSAYLPISQSDSIGKIRETFFVNQLQNAKYKVFYSEKGDFEVDGMIFEIGGKSKKTKQIKDVKNSYLACDDIVIGSENKVPLYMFGLVY